MIRTGLIFTTIMHFGLMCSCTVIKVPSEAVVKVYPGFVYIRSGEEVSYDMKSVGVQLFDKGIHIGAIKEQAVINPKNNQSFTFPIYANYE